MRSLSALGARGIALHAKPRYHSPDMGTVSDILEAIRTLPRPERVQLFERLATELGDESRPPTEERVPSDPGSNSETGSTCSRGRSMSTPSTIAGAARSEPTT